MISAFEFNENLINIDFGPWHDDKISINKTIRKIKKEIEKRAITPFIPRISIIPQIKKK